MAGPNYTSVNITKEQHEQLKKLRTSRKSRLLMWAWKWPPSISRDSWTNTAK